MFPTLPSDPEGRGSTSSVWVRAGDCGRWPLKNPPLKGFNEATKESLDCSPRTAADGPERQK